MARILLAMDRWPSLQRTAIMTLARRPELFRALLDLHIGEAAFGAFVLRHGIELAWELLRSTHSQDASSPSARPQPFQSPAQQDELRAEART